MDINRGGGPVQPRTQGPEGKWEVIRVAAVVRESMVARSRVTAGAGEGFQRSRVVVWSGLGCEGRGRPGRLGSADWMGWG